MTAGEYERPAEAGVQQGVRAFSPAALRNARRRMGWSQAELAEAGEVSESAIAGWERGTVRPTINRLRVVVDALGIPIDELLRSPGGKAWSLVDLRALRRLTLLEAAVAAKVSKTTLGRLENGYGRLSSPVAEKIAVFYDIETAEVEAAFQASKRELQRRLQARRAEHDTP